jgi:hypothetical protein
MELKTIKFHIKSNFNSYFNIIELRAHLTQVGTIGRRPTSVDGDGAAASGR